MGKRTVVTALVLGFLGGCATTPAPVADPDVAGLLEVAPPPVPDEEDELRAYAPEVYLSGLAGHGVSGDLDLSASCGCAETSGSGPSGSTGPGSGPGVEYQKRATLHVIIHLPPVGPAGDGRGR